MSMQNHNNDTIKTSDTVLRKIYLSLYLKGLCVRGSWRLNRTATYWPPTLMAISVSFPFSLAVQAGVWGPSLSGTCSSIQHLLTNWSDLQTAQSGAWGLPQLGAGFLYRILSPTGLVSKLTDYLSSPSYIIVQRSPSSCGRHKLHSFPHPRSRLHSAITRPDASVIYIGAFPILTARAGRMSIYNTSLLSLFLYF